jgi:serine/threonine protein kinase
MKHENIVELYDYTENENEIVLLMEYCNDANYFEQKLEEVSIFIKISIKSKFTKCTLTDSCIKSLILLRHITNQRYF